MCFKTLSQLPLHAVHYPGQQLARRVLTLLVFGVSVHENSEQGTIGVCQTGLFMLKTT